MVPKFLAIAAMLPACALASGAATEQAETSAQAGGDMSMIIVLTICFIVGYLIYKRRKNGGGSARTGGVKWWSLIFGVLLAFASLSLLSTLPGKETDAGPVIAGAVVLAVPAFFLLRRAFRGSTTAVARLKGESENLGSVILHEDGSFTLPSGEPADVSAWKEDRQIKTILLQYRNGVPPEIAVAALRRLEGFKAGKYDLDKMLRKYFDWWLLSMTSDKYFSREEEAFMTEVISLCGSHLGHMSDESIQAFKIARLVRDLLEGTPNPVISADEYGVMLSRNEIPVWAESNVEISVPKTVRQYHAGNRGVSIKIAKGVYYRTGGTRGYSESRQIQASEGRGFILATNHNLFISSAQTTRKISLDKVINVVPYRNGIDLNYEGGRGKPLFIGVKTPGLWANIIANARNWR